VLADLHDVARRVDLGASSLEDANNQRRSPPIADFDRIV
jgi:hypothetical protein